MWRIELRKLAAQMRVRVVLAVFVAIPIGFVAIMSVQTTVPTDTLFGRWVHESGFADSLLILGYADLWLLPVAVGVLAGDIFSEEDRHRTWGLLLTRGRSRGEVFAGKVLAALTVTLLATLVLGIASTVVGVLVVGHQPLVGLSGTMLRPSAALSATAGSWVSELAPVTATTAVAVVVSILSRNGWVGVLGPVVAVVGIDLLSMLSSLDPIRPLLWTSGFEAWHGLPRSGVYLGEIRDSLEASAVWTALLLATAAWVFVRRDVVEP